MAGAREVDRHDIEKAKEEKAEMVATALKRKYKGEINRLKGLLQDSKTQNDKIACLEVQLIEEKSTVEAKLVQDRLYVDKKEKSLAAICPTRRGSTKVV